MRDEVLHVAEVDVAHATARARCRARRPLSIATSNEHDRDPRQHHVAERAAGSRTSTPSSIRNVTTQRARRVDDDEQLAREVHLLDQVARCRRASPARRSCRSDRSSTAAARTAGTARSSCRPLGSPVGGSTFEEARRRRASRSTTVESGLSSDHVQPRTDFLYLLRSSRSVRLTTSSRVPAYSLQRETWPASR